jgi:hypothetical protein
MKFDETNLLKRTKGLYKELSVLNEEAFLEMANEIYKEAYPESKKKLDKKWLALILLGYDATTKYVYEHEVDRKRARLYEALMSTKTNAEFITAFNLWWRQTSQYAITISDTAVIQAFKDKGIKKVKWNTEKDNRVCHTCKDRNGKVYDIDKVPDKPHYGCRCWYSEVSE